jgi:Rieske 2Fe-2S family protein
VFAAEMERYYFGSWICAGRAGQIEGPGDYFLRDVAGESIIITRDGRGAVRGFYNVCRHRGTRMCTAGEGRFDGRIQCPYHGWTYALNGCLIGAPHMGELDFSREEYPLHSVGAELWDGHVFIHLGKQLGKQLEPLAQQLGRLPEKFAPWRMHELQLHKRIVYEVKANWKLIVLNYNECLHCPMLHPVLNGLTNYLGADNDCPTPSYCGGAMGFASGVETMSMDGKRRREYLPGLSEEQRNRVYYYAIYPNLLLSLHPDYMMTHTLWPKAVDRTEVICEWHFHPAEVAKPDFHSADAIDFWDLTNREDWRISELSQAGIQSRAYTPGPYSTREELLHAFDVTVLDLERRSV